MCNSYEMWEPLQKIWTAQKSRGVQEKGKEVAQAVICKDVLVIWEHCHTLPLLLYLQMLSLSPRTALWVLCIGSAPEYKSQSELFNMVWQIT